MTQRASGEIAAELEDAIAFVRGRWALPDEPSPSGSAALSCPLTIVQLAGKSLPK